MIAGDLNSKGFEMRTFVTALTIFVVTEAASLRTRQVEASAVDVKLAQTETQHEEYVSRFDRDRTLAQIRSEVRAKARARTCSKSAC